MEVATTRKPQKCLIRIPIRIPCDGIEMDRSIKVKDQVALLHYFSHSLQIKTNGPNSQTPSVWPGEPDEQWTITGVVDSDDMNTVPRLLAGNPPQWVWINEEEHASKWSGDFDMLDLNHDELLIKA